MVVWLLESFVSDVLSIVWFAAAGVGAVALISAVLVKRWRREFLIAVGSCFAVAGILGLASIGIFFLAASAACFVLVSRADNAARDRSGSSEFPEASR